MVHPWTCDLRSFSLLFIGRHRTITFTASGPCVIFKLVSPLLHPLYLLSTADGKKQKFKTEISCSDFFHFFRQNLSFLYYCENKYIDSVDKNKFPSEYRLPLMKPFFFIAYMNDTCIQRKVVERVTGLNRKGLYLLFDYGWLGV